ncbi:Basal body protein [Giardia lamblia P15]|uniref:Basal body protein n=1 Tax=Giardia intestinalis (strain P15) TaxID=658858 RepID=E1EXZ3_GIAIA|nr:Basal body protein [Giardia lamblia P15]
MSQFIGPKSSLPAIYEAYQRLQYGEYSLCAASTEDMLRTDRTNQQAFLLRLQCATEASYLDETELDTIGFMDATRNMSFQMPRDISLQQQQSKENELEKNNFTHPCLSPVSASVRQIEVGFVRPATNAAGKPLTRGTSRLVSNTRTGSCIGSRVGSRAGSRANSRTGSRSSTATVAAAVVKGFAGNTLSSHLELRTGSLCNLLQEFPVNFIAHGNYTRLLIAYMTRMLPTKLDYLLLTENSAASRSAFGNKDINIPPECIDVTPMPRHALFFLSKINSSNCSDWFYNDRKGRTYYSMGCYNDSEKHFRNALRESPRVSTYLKLASTLVARGHINSGILILRECVERFQTSAAPHLAMARLYELIQNYEKCACSYADALERNPSNVEALASLASLLVQGVGLGAKTLGKKVLHTLESPSTSLILYKRVLLFIPADPAIWNNLGVCYIEKHQYHDAFIHLLTALNRLETARRELSFSDDRVVRMHSDIWFNIGVCFLHLSDMAAAKNCFTIVSKIDCTHVEALVNLAILLVISAQGSTQGDDIHTAYKKALFLLNHALDINPHHDYALHNRIVIYRRMGNIEKALVDAMLVAPDIAFEMERELC